MSELPIGRIYDEQSIEYAGYGDNRFAWRFLEKPAFDTYISDLYDPKTKVLEVGCGDGIVTRHLIERGIPAQNITAIDPSAKQIARAKGLIPEATFIQARAGSMELEADSVDLVVMNTVLHHLDDIEVEAALENIYHALRPGGVFFCVEVDPDQSEESFNPELLYTWKDVETPWGTTVPFFNRTLRDFFDALDRHGFDFVAGKPLVVPAEAKTVSPNEYQHYVSRPSRIAARFQKVPLITKMPRFYDVQTPNLVRTPEEEVQADIVATYFRAWNQQSLDEVQAIFSPDATYDEKPGKTPAIVGLDNILLYWQQNPMSQQDINTYYHIMGHSHDGAVWVRFEASFVSHIGQDAIRGCMKLQTDASSNRITELKEWYEHV